MASNRLRVLLSTVAVLLGVAAIMGSLTAIGAIEARLIQGAAAAAGRADLEVHALAEHGFPVAVVEQIRRIEGVSLVAPILEKRTYLRAPAVRGFVQLIGVDPHADTPVYGLTLGAGRWPQPEAREMALLQSWAAAHGLELGSSADLITRDGFQTFRVVGLLSDAGSARRSFGRVAFVSLHTAQQSFGMEQRLTHLALALDSPRQRQHVVERLEALLPGRFSVLYPEDLGAELRQAVEQLTLGLAVFGVTAIFVGAFLIHNTLSMTVAEQRRQIGLLRAAGVTRRQVLTFVLLQAAALGVLGSTLGTVVGSALAHALVSALAGPGGLAFVVPLSPAAALLSLAVGIGVTLLSASLPAWRAATIPPLDALRGSESHPPATSTWANRLAAAGLLLGGAAALSWPLPAAPAASRALGVLLLLCAAGVMATALVGPLSRLCAVPFRWALGPEARLAELNLRSSERRAGLTLVGFTTSLALTVALAGLGASMATAGQERAASLFPGELLVVSPVPQPMRLLEEFRRQPGVGSVTPVRPLSIAWGTTWLDAIAVDPDDYALSIRSMLAEGSQAAVQRFRTRRALLVPARLAQARGMRIGDHLSLQTVHGLIDFEVAGLLAFSFPSADNLGAVMLSYEDVVHYFGVDGFTVLAIRPAPGTTADALAPPLGRAAERFGMELVSVETIRDALGSAVGHLLTAFGGLISVGMIVAGLSVVNTMMMNVAERRRELGVLRALGLTRWQVRVMVLAEAGMMGLIGGVLGVASGLFLARLLLVLISSPDFDPQPVWPLAPAALSLAVATALAMLAAWPPARSAARLHVSRVIYAE